MSDAQLPPDAVDGEGEPPGQRAADSGPIVISLKARDDSSTGAAPTSGADHQLNGEAGAVLPLLPDKGPPLLTLAAESAFDDYQPMLDLRFPEPAHALPHLPTGSGDAATAAAPLREVPPESSGQETSDRLPPGGDPPAEPLDAAGLSPIADIKVEVTPIFSALDVADKAAETLQQGNPAPQIDAFEVGILVPGSQQADDVVSDAGAEPDQDAASPDTPVMTTGAASTPDADAAAAEPNRDAAPEADEDARPAELLQDAAARIAAEASATAAALENLKRLLAHKLPEPMISPTQGTREDIPEPSEAPAVPAHLPPVHMPVQPPPMMEAPLIPDGMPPPAGESSIRRSGIAVGSFFAGFALSWVVGAVLYVFLTAG